MNREEAERILAALKSGTPHIDRHKAAESLEWALGPRWISVEERLPEIGVVVLARGSDAIFFSERYMPNGHWDESNGIVVTHWQPLPVGPGVRDE